MAKNSPSIPGAAAMPPAPSSIPGTPSQLINPNLTTIEEMGSNSLSAGFGFRWQGVIEIQHKLDEMNQKIEESVHQLVELLAAEMESWAQSNASWNDRTGDARKGLTGFPEHEGNVSRAVIAHTVDYWFALEIMHGGTYAILLPTVLHFAAQANAVLGMVEI